MNIDNIEGLVTLKTYIENVIIPYMKKNYTDNYFVNNLIYNTQFNLLFGKRFGSYASRIDTTDSLNNEDQINLIKNDFYKIQDDMIDGHTLYD